MFDDAMFVSECGFLGESMIGFVISDHKDSSLPKKRKIQKRIIYHDNTDVLVLIVGKKIKQQTDPHSEDKKKKQHKQRMNIRNEWGGHEYISVETQTFLE